MSVEEAERQEAQSLHHRKRTTTAPLDRKKKQKQNPDDPDSDFYLLQNVDEDEEIALLDRQEVELRAMKARTKALLDALDEGTGSAGDDQPVFGADQPKIFFASRTHSQLAQFVGQLRLPKFKASVPKPFVLGEEAVKEISLSSRKQLCIHPTISKYNSVQKMNDACLDLQKPKSKSKSEGACNCEYMVNTKDVRGRVRYREFRNAAIAKIRDIEDLAELGKQKRVCPYYATREVANNGWAEVIALPYQLLLQKESRDALGINLKNSVVIVDEAHNLIDTISSLHSMELTFSQASRALTGLQTYQNRFQNRLSGHNRIWLSKLIVTVKSIVSFLKAAQKKPAKETAPGQSIAASSFFSKNGAADTINVHHLEKFVKQSRLVFKIESYLEVSEENSDHLVLGKVISFLLAIGNPSRDGKFFFGRSAAKELQVQYLLLDPSTKFKEIVDECRCVVLAGGTMKPTDDYLNYLLPYLDNDQISVFSCDHIIPDENLVVLPIGRRNQTRFNFTFAERNSKVMIQQLGYTIIDICKKVPDGVVVFLPSYMYMSSVLKIWESEYVPGEPKHTILDAMKAQKSVFWEPQGGGDFSSGSSATTAPTTKILDAYARAIADPSTRGAMLFAVVGGKMSEGINFSDGLARAVVMVGLPFPHAFSVEMVAKREHIERATLRRLLDANAPQAQAQFQAKAQAREFYENVCMRAVNQCVGRAIRHAGDYAAVLLVDERYGAPHIQAKLSGWVRRRIADRGESAAALDDLASSQKLDRFFSTKQ